MSSFTTYANGLSVAGKATAHAARCIAPDVCNTPAMVPTPFPNYIFTSELGTNATANTRICGAPVWKADGQLDATPSLPAHAGTLGGVVTGTYCSYAKAITFSANVLTETLGVVRMTDLTIQNEGNTLGMVVDADSIAAWLAGWGDGVGDGLGKGTGGGKGPGDDEGPDDAEGDGGETVDDPVDDEEGEAEEDQCELVGTSIQCGHGRGPGGTSLEVLQGDSITVSCEFEGECPDGLHPKWMMPGASPAELVGPKGTMKLAGPGASFSATGKPGHTASGGVSGGGFSLSGSVKRSAGGAGSFAKGVGIGASIGKLIELSTATPTRQSLSAEAHVGNAEYEILVYPSDKVSLDDLIPDSIKKVLNKLERSVKSLSKAGSGSVEGTLSFLKGSIAVQGGWQEWTDHTCFFGFQLDIGFKPLISASLKIYIPFGPFEPVRKALAKIGVQLGLYVEIGGSCDLVLSVGRMSPGPIPGASLTLTFTATLALGADIRIAKSAVHAEIRGEGSMSADYGVSCSQLFRADVNFFIGPVSAGPIKGILTVRSTSYWVGKLIGWLGGEKKRGVTELKAEYTFMDKKTLMEKEETVLIKAG